MPDCASGESPVPGAYSSEPDSRFYSPSVPEFFLSSFDPEFPEFFLSSFDPEFFFVSSVDDFATSLYF